MRKVNNKIAKKNTIEEIFIKPCIPPPFFSQQVANILGNSGSTFLMGGKSEFLTVDGISCYPSQYGSGIQYFNYLILLWQDNVNFRIEYPKEDDCYEYFCDIEDTIFRILDELNGIRHDGNNGGGASGGGGSGGGGGGSNTGYEEGSAIRPVIITVTGITTGYQYINSYPYKYDKNTGVKFEVPLYQIIVSGKESENSTESYHFFSAIRFGVQKHSATDSERVVGKSNADTRKVQAWIPNSYDNSGSYWIYDNYLIHIGQKNLDDCHSGNLGCIAIVNPHNDYLRFKNSI